MKSRLLFLALVCALGLGAAAYAQAPKSDKGGEKKAPPAKSPADLAAEEFFKIRNEQGAKQDQARFAKVIAAGISYLQQYPTHGRANEVIRELGNYAGVKIDKAQMPLRVAFMSQLKYEALNARYKEGLSNDAVAALAALEASVADSEVRDVSPSKDNLTALREKIDALATMPGAGRYLVDRERSYFTVLTLGVSPARGEEHLRKMLESPEKGVVNWAREELNIVDVKKEPYALKFTALDGKPVDFSQMRGKVVALYFWSAANGQSTRNFDPLKQIYSDYRKRGFEVVTVSYDKSEDREKLEKYIKENKIAWPVYFDGKAAKNDFSPKLNASGVPRLMLFDQKGVLQSTLQGAYLVHTLQVNQLEPQVKKLLGVK